MRLYGQLFAYVPPRPGWSGRRATALGAVPGDDPLLLLENRFRAGGPTTVRGFEQNGLGPQTAEGDSLGGQAVVGPQPGAALPDLEAPEGRRLLGRRQRLAAVGPSFRSSDLRQSVGGGLRYMFPFGPIRVEYAWILEAARRASRRAASSSASATRSDPDRSRGRVRVPSERSVLGRPSPFEAYQEVAPQRQGEGAAARALSAMQIEAQPEPDRS